MLPFVGFEGRHHFPASIMTPEGDSELRFFSEELVKKKWRRKRVLVFI